MRGNLKNVVGQMRRDLNSECDMSMRIVQVICMLIANMIYGSNVYKNRLYKNL